MILHILKWISVCEIIMKNWNTGILGVKVEIDGFNFKKLLQIQHSITPSFHYSNWGKGPKFFLA
jgi:hypothetical protein